MSGYKGKIETGRHHFDLKKELMRYRKIDSNAHINPSTGDADNLLRYADMLYIEKLAISVPAETGSLTPGMFKENNDKVLRAVRKYPGRLIGKMTVNPQFGRESLDEVDRCVDQGLMIIKVFTQVKINDPLFFPVIEKAARLKILIQMHGECQLGVGGYRMKYDIKDRPGASIPEDFAGIARRYPEAKFQFAHIGGGGDVEYACKTIKDHTNIYADLSGSNNEDTLVNVCLKYLGDNRIFFGTDGSYYQSVSTILSSDITFDLKKKIFYDNFYKIMKMSGIELT